MSVVFATGSASVAGTSETAIVSSQPTNGINLQGLGMKISGMINFSGNASASTVTLKVRQGTGTSGTVVWTSPALTVAAAAVAQLPYEAQDLVQGVATYTLTATFSAAPAVATVNGTITLTDAGYSAD
ncbi:MAG TPA: hypothetical protein VGE93_06455 [Bryobacteraceae bacterium]